VTTVAQPTMTHPTIHAPQPDFTITVSHQKFAYEQNINRGFCEPANDLIHFATTSHKQSAIKQTLHFFLRMNKRSLTLCNNVCENKRDLANGALPSANEQTIFLTLPLNHTGPSKRCTSFGDSRTWAIHGSHTLSTCHTIAWHIPRYTFC
jgi:hypothetical protein